MSVKFQETTQTKVTEGVAAGAAAAGTATESLKDVAKKAHEKREELTHRIGEYLTGGDTGQGYLAVRSKKKVCAEQRLTLIVVSQAIANEPSAYQNAHFWRPGGLARSPRIVACS